MGSQIMALVLLGLFALMLYLVIRLGASAAAWMSGTRYRPYKQLAMRYRGRFERFEPVAAALRSVRQDDQAIRAVHRSHQFKSVRRAQHA